MSDAADPNAPPPHDVRGRNGRLGAEIERIAQLGSWEWDIPGDRITWSEGLFRMYGLEPGERWAATYDEYVSLLHPDDRDRIQQVIAESRRTGEPFVHVHRIVRPNGEIRTVLGRGEVVRGADGEPVRMVGTAQDVTERMQIEREVAARLAAEEQAAELAAQAAELEAATAQNEVAHDELRVTAAALLRRTDEAEASRREITSILESIGDAFFALDDSWRFTYLNERGEKLLQRTRAELVGRELWTEFPESIGTSFETVYRRVMQSRAAERFEAYFAPLDLWADVSAFPSLTGGIAVYFQDATVRRRGEIQFATLAETMPQLVWSTTGDGYHDYYNSRWYEYTGMPREGSQGWNWKNFLHPDDYGRTVEQWKQSLVSGEPYSIEYRFREARTGAYRWFLGRALPLRDEQGRIIRWFGTCTDIDDTKRAEADRDRALESAQQARVEAESANRAKADFLATMSHELRTPINAALGYSELLSMGVRGPVTPAQVEDLTRIQRSQRLLLSLVNDILNFARLEAGKIELHLTDVRLDQVLAELESMVAPQVAAKRLRFTQHDCRDVSARADLERLQQVLLNLLTNAIKFTAVDGEIELRCADQGDWVTLSVRDTGRGIAADQLERVFEPFVQVDRHLTQASQQGVGLGLAISRDLMRAMGGELEATSTLGVGSTFVARIPRAT